MDALSLDQNHPNQCRCKVGKHVVAYVCFGEGMPINWLPKTVSGLSLTDSEKITVAKYIRSEMAKRNQARSATVDELAQLSSPNYQHEQPNGVDQGPDSGGINETQDTDDSSS